MVSYLENAHVWDQSRSFRVVARNGALVPNAASGLGQFDGHPDPVYEPAPQVPELFRWRGYWISIVRAYSRIYPRIFCPDPIYRTKIYKATSTITDRKRAELW